MTSDDITSNVNGRMVGTTMIGGLDKSFIGNFSGEKIEFWQIKHNATDQKELQPLDHYNLKTSFNSNMGYVLVSLSIASSGASARGGKALQMDMQKNSLFNYCGANR